MNRTLSIFDLFRRRGKWLHPAHGLTEMSGQGVIAMSNIRAKGVQLFREIMGEQRARTLQEAAESKGFGADIAGLALDFAFGSVWTRAGLERKQRSILTIGMLLASHQILELKNHIRIGVANGLTARELEEVLIHAVPYVGFPAVASATTAVVEVLRELGLDTETKTAEERGLL
jgi:4-carboxymuconolactone decarboxylase